MSTSETMKRRTNLLDYIKQPLSTPRIQFPSPNTSFPQKSTSAQPRLIQYVCILVILLFSAIYIHITTRLQTSTVIEAPTNQAPIPNPPITTDALLLDHRHELINTEDIIMQNQHTKRHIQPTSIDTALRFTDEDCTTKLECGRCWLYHHLNLVIEISSIIPIPRNRLDVSYTNLDLSAYWITLRAINNATICNAKDITIYLSIIDLNHESVGGLAIRDSTSLCGWKYKWIVSQPGQYTINAHVLYYRGYLDFNQNKCHNVKNIQYVDTSDDESHTLRKLPPKWRFYGQVEGCCEWCNRMNGKCKAWSSGGGGSDKCMLYTASPMDEDSPVTITKHNGYISGLYRNEPSQWYLGSLLNIQPNACHNTKLDLIYNSGQIYDVDTQMFVGTSTQQSLCASNHEMGRWVSLKHMECNTNEFNSWCWIQRHFNKVPFRWKSYQCSYAQRVVGDVHQCLVEKNVNRIAVGGDSLIRLFSLEMVRYIFGDPLMKGNDVPNWGYSKHYESNDVQVWFMGYDHHIDDISFMKEFIVEPDNVNKPNVFIHNFQVIHKMWHHNVTEFVQIMHVYKDSANELFTKYYGAQSERNWPVRLVFEAPLLVSEREYHDTADRAIIYNKIMRDVLEPEGWVFVPVFEMSKARMYDSTNPKDGVVDGMHMSSNLLIEIARVTVDMLCRFDLKHHIKDNLNKLYMSV
eukprot:640344_1